MQCVRDGEVRRRFWIYNVSLLEWSPENAVGVILKAFLVATFECVPGSLAAGLGKICPSKTRFSQPKTPTSSPQAPWDARRWASDSGTSQNAFFRSENKPTRGLTHEPRPRRSFAR